MPDVALPIVKSFRIPALDWTVVDYRNLDHARKSQAESRWSKAVKEYVATIRVDPDVILCKIAIPQQRDDFDRGLAKAFLRDENVDLEAYAKDHPVKTYTYHTGIENRATLLAVSFKDRIIGGIYVATYVVESETREKLTARSLLWVAVEPRRGLSDIDVKLDAIRFLIENDLKLDDGRILDFVEWIQSTDIPRSEWGPERAPMVEFYDRLEQVLDKSVDPETGNFRFRRPGAEPRPQIGD